MELRVAVDATNDPEAAAILLGLLATTLEALGISVTRHEFAKSKDIVALAQANPQSAIATLTSVPELSVRFIEMVDVGDSLPEGVTKGNLSGVAVTQNGVMGLDEFGLDREHMNELIEKAIDIIGRPESDEDDQRLSDYVKGSLGDYLSELGIPFTSIEVTILHSPTGFQIAVAIQHNRKDD